MNARQRRQYRRHTDSGRLLAELRRAKWSGDTAAVWRARIALMDARERLAFDRYGMWRMQPGE